LPSESHNRVPSPRTNVTGCGGYVGMRCELRAATPCFRGGSAPTPHAAGFGGHSTERSRHFTRRSSADPR
jgi:hypothetical protein